MNRPDAMASILANPFCEYEPGVLEHALFDKGQLTDCFNWLIMPRLGRRPLHICGRILVHASNRCVGLSAWSEITLYETRAGNFASSLTHHLSESLGGAWSDSALHSSALALQRALYSHDPMIAVSLAHVDSTMSGTRFQETAQHVALAGMFRGAWFGMARALFGSDPQ